LLKKGERNKREASRVRKKKRSRETQEAKITILIFVNMLLYTERDTQKQEKMSRNAGKQKHTDNRKKKE
jgi:hypothetical protein